MDEEVNMGNDASFDSRDEISALEKIPHKELGWSRLSETLLQHHMNSEENEASHSDLIHDKACLNPLRGKAQGSLDTLKKEVENQLEILSKELTDIRKLVKVNAANPSEKIFGIGNVEHEKGSRKWIDVDGMFDLLKRILDVAFKQKNEMELLSLRQQEHDYQKEIELLVITSFVQSLNDKYEQRLWKQNAEFCGSRTLMLEKTNELAGLREELKLISKLFSGHSNRDIESWEVGNQKRADQLHNKVFGTLWDSNGKHIASVVMPNLEALKQLSHEQLVNYIKTEMNQMKRDQDCAIQELTEQYFSFKRKYLNLEERNSFLSLKKHNEFDVLRKKIPCMISKLDKILLEDEKLVFEGNNKAKKFQSQFDSLLLENYRLRESLSKADQRILELSQVEANHQKLIEKLKTDVEDSDVKASISADVYGTFLDQIKSYMTEEFCEVIYKEVLKEADAKLGDLNMSVSEKEQDLRSEMFQKERLKEKIHRLECHVKEMGNLVQIAERERERNEKVFEQINNLQSQISQQEAMIQDKNKELEVVSADNLEKVEGYEMEMSKLKQELEIARENMKITENEKRKSELILSFSETEQKKLKDQFVSLVLSLTKLNKDFDNLENLVAEKLKSNQSKLSDLVNGFDELKGQSWRYKQGLEKTTCDLQKAETEVDLLGDEVESLLHLLEKIYIALDHYSPILKHYPGVIEILKLVWRQLVGNQEDYQSYDGS